MTVIEQNAYKALIRMDESLYSIAQSLITLAKAAESQSRINPLIAETALSTRAKTVLTKFFPKVKTVRDLSNLTATEIKLTRMAGDKTVEDIQDCLGRFGLQLR